MNGPGNGVGKKEKNMSIDAKKTEEKFSGEYLSTDWVEIFEGGKQTDSKGREKHYGDKELDYIVNSYDPSRREAPLVFGHPKHDDPAYGMVEKVKRAGQKILAKFKQVPRAVVEVIKNGHYPKRSVSLRADGSLRHVGLLGAVTPAIPGLTDIKFNKDDEDAFVFYFENGGSEMDEKEKEIQELKAQIETLKASSEFKEAEAKLSKLEAEKTALENTLKSKDQRILDLESEKKRKSYEDFCEELGKDGLLKPACKSLVMDFQEMLDTGDYEFSEGGKKDSLKELQQFLKENLKQQVDFSEIATKKRAASGSSKPSNYSENCNSDEMELDAKATEYAEKHDVSYEVAIKKVRSMK